MQIIGPVRKDAALAESLPASTGGRRQGKRLPSITVMLDSTDPRWPACRYDMWTTWLNKSESQAELEARYAWPLKDLATAA